MLFTFYIWTQTEGTADTNIPTLSMMTVGTANCLGQGQTLVHLNTEDTEP